MAFRWIVNDGISFLPTLLGDVQRQKEHPYLYWEYPDAKIGMKAIRMGRWKGIISDIRKGNQTMELFDLDKDVTEETNVANEHPEILVGKINVDEEEELASLFSIRSIPTLIFIEKNGTMHRSQGAMGKPQLKEAIEKILL